MAVKAVLVGVGSGVERLSFIFMIIGLVSSPDMAFVYRSFI